MKLLPLDLDMNDLFNREKYGALPQSLSTDATPAYSYAIGDIGYWPPCHDLAIYYRHDGENIPSPGIIVIGKIQSDMQAFNDPGLAKVRIELNDRA